MSEPLQNNNPGGNKKGKSENNASSSNPKRGGFKRKYLRPSEAGSKYIVISDQRNNNNSQNPPPPPPLPVPDGAAAATGSGSNAVVGQSFTGVIDGIFSGGYLLSVKIGNSNGPILKGVVFKPESQVSAEIDLGESHLPTPFANTRMGPFEINLTYTSEGEEEEEEEEEEYEVEEEEEEEEEEYEVEEEESPLVDELSEELVLYTGNSHPSYSSSSSSSSLIESTEPLESSSSSRFGAKVVPVVFKPANDLSHLRKGKRISRDYSRDKDHFLPVNWPSPAIGIPPPPPSLRIEGTSADIIVTPSPLPDIGFGRERGRETPITGGDYERNFKEAAAVVNEKMSQFVLSQQTQQNVRERDS